MADGNRYKSGKHDKKNKKDRKVEKTTKSSETANKAADANDIHRKKNKLSETIELSIDAINAVSDEESENDDAKERVKAPERKMTRDEKEKRVRRFTLLGIIIVLLVAIGIVLWMLIPNSGKSHYENNAAGTASYSTGENSEGFPLAISGLGVDSGNLMTYDGNACYVSDTSIVGVSNKGKELYNKSHSYYRPIARNAGEYVMVYNAGNKGYRVEKGTNTITDTTTENNLMAADVAENGKYAIVTEAKDYPSYLEVYKADGSLQYTYYFSNCYVQDVALSEDGTHGAIIGITASEGSVASELYLLDFSKEKPVAQQSITGTMLMKAEYADGKVLAVGDNKTVSMNSKGEISEYEYSKKLAAFDIEGTQAIIALDAHDSESNGTAVVLNSDAGEVCALDYSGSAKDVALCGNTMAILKSDGVYFYSVSGARAFKSGDGSLMDASREIETTNDAEAIELASENAVYILGVSDISYVS